MCVIFRVHWYETIRMVEKLLEKLDQGGNRVTFMMMMPALLPQVEGATSGEILRLKEFQQILLSLIAST